MNHDRIAGIVILAFCAFFYYQSFGISNQNLTGLEATFFPRVLLAAIAALALLLLVRSFFIKSAAVRKVGLEKEGEEVGAPKKWWKVPLIFVLFAVYILLIDILGFTISSFLFMTIVYLIAITATRLKKTVKKHAVSIGFLLVVSITLTFIFEKFLSVYLPKGLFF